MLDRRVFVPGDRVIFRCEKRSAHPGPHAEEIHPEPSGEGYRYWIRKFWVVDRILPDGSLEVRTRRGKLHNLHPDDPNLRRAHWWEKLIYHDRFPWPGQHPASVQPKSRAAQPR